MRTIFFTTFLVCGFCPAFLWSQLQTPRFTASPDRPNIGYLEYLPPGYDTASQNFPVIIFLHGSGESGDGSSWQLERVKAWGPPSMIQKGHDMCFTVNGKKECFIVISPQIITEAYTWPSFVPTVINHVLNGPLHYKADPDRIYLTGLSLGGYGTYGYASGPFNRPNTLAAIAPIAGGMRQGDDGCKISKRGIPVWAFHGRLDTIVPYGYGLTAFNNVLYCSDHAPTADMILTTYEDRYHDSWIPAYDTGHAYHDPNLYEWLLMHRRIPDPILSVDDPLHDTFSIHPNPSQEDLLSFSFNDQPLTHQTVTIWNATGECVLSNTDASGPVDVSGLRAGVYIVQLVGSNGTMATERLIKLK